MLKAGRINFSFAAAHHLPGHDGLCKNLHGHNYKLEVEVAGQANSGSGMLIDFANLKDMVKKGIVNYLDHKCLNDLGAPFSENPTAENIVNWIACKLSGMIDTMGGFFNLSKVKLWETDNCYVEWTKD